MDGGSGRRRISLTFIAVASAAWTTVIDSTAVSVTLPAIAAHFESSAAAVTWVISATQIVLVALLLPLSSYADKIGYRRVFLASLVLLIVATPLCIIAPTLEFLVAARALQAVGMAGVMGVNFALLRQFMPPERFGTAVGIMALVVALASSAGPAMAGLLLAYASWHWVFGSLLPFATLSLCVGYALLPPDNKREQVFDLRGAVLSALMLGGLVIAVNALTHRWAPVFAVVFMVLTCVAAALLFRGTRRAQHSATPFTLLRSPIFALSVTASVCAFAAQFLAFVALPFYFIHEFSLTEIQVGLVFTAWPAVVACVAPIAGRLSDRLPAGPIGFAGMVVLITGLVLLITMPPDVGLVDIAWRMGICGLGFGAFQTPNNRLIMVTAPRARSGAASGLLATSRQFGRAIGAAAASFALGVGAAGDPRLALTIACGVAGVGAAASLARRPQTHSI